MNGTCVAYECGHFLGFLGFRDAVFLVQVMAPQRVNYFVCIYLAPGNYRVLL